MNRYALVVGSQIEGLTGVEHDTFRMHDALRERGFAVELRFGGTATRRGILDGYDGLIARSSAGDAAVIFDNLHSLHDVVSDVLASSVVATTGRPHAIASSSALQKPSLRESRQNASLILSRGTGSATKPSSFTFFSRPRERIIDCISSE